MKTTILYIITSVILSGNTVWAQTTCDKPAPPNTADVRPPTIDWVWENRIRVDDNGNSMAFTFKNFGFDQIIANGGYLNYLVRWESDETVTAIQRDEIAAMLQRQMDKWIDTWLKGYDCWPYDNVKVNVVAWAVKNRATLLWNDADWTGKVYVGIYEPNDVNQAEPTGPRECNRFYNRNGQYPNCTGGTSQHFDMSLWCTKGFGGGAGGDWGQRLSSSYILTNRNSENVHILLHEIGHTFGLPDFYTTAQFPPSSTGGLPKAVMQAGASTVITPWDGWMLRRVWSELRQRTDRGWILSVTNINDAIETNKASIYPNPFSDFITIEMKGKFQYQLYDLLGNILEEGDGLDYKNTGQGISSGVYVLKMQQKDATQILKITKQ